MDFPRPTNAEMAKLVGLLLDAGLVEVFTDADGREAYRLTGEGACIGRMLAMGRGAEADAVLEALLDGEAGTGFLPTRGALAARAPAPRARTGGPLSVMKRRPKEHMDGGLPAAWRDACPTRRSIDKRCPASIDRPSGRLRGLC